MTTTDTFEEAVESFAVLLDEDAEDVRSAPEAMKMGKYKIHRDFGFIGTHGCREVEAEDQKQAEDMAEEYAQERMTCWAEKIEEDET